jgi:hypothetical protein
LVSLGRGFNVLEDRDDPDILLRQQPAGELLRSNLIMRHRQSVGPQVRSCSGAQASEMKYRFGWDAPLVR